MTIQTQLDKITGHLRVLEGQMTKVAEILKTQAATIEMVVDAAEAHFERTDALEQMLERLEAYCYKTDTGKPEDFPDWEAMSRGKGPDDSGTGGVA